MWLVYMLYYYVKQSIDILFISIEYSFADKNVKMKKKDLTRSYDESPNTRKQQKQ